MQATVTVTVVAVADAGQTTQNHPVTVDVVGNDSAGNAPLDPTTVTVVTPAGDIPGTVTVDPATGAITFVPAADFVGTTDIVYQVCDTSGSCATATLTVTVAGPPTAVDDVAQTSAGVAVRIDVLANDAASDATIAQAQLNPGSVRVVAGPAANEGTVLVDSATGAITFVPAAGFTGVSVFRYEVCDSSTPVPPAANCVQATVTVTVVAGPTAVADAGQTTQNHPETVDVVGNDSAGNALLDPTTATVLTLAGNIPGTVTVDPATGAITFVPAADFVGTTDSVYQVCDTSGLCATATWTVTVAGPPTSIGIELLVITKTSSFRREGIPD